MWHNSFKDLLQLPEKPKKLLASIFPSQNLIKRNNIIESLIMKGFQQGTDLTKLAKTLKIPINPGFDNVIVVCDNMKSVIQNDINLHLLGPTKKNIEK